MEAELKQQLIDVSTAFAASRLIGITTVWRMAINDPAFEGRLKSDKTITVRTFDKAIAWFSGNWPAELPWPESVARPVSTLSEGS